MQTQDQHTTLNAANRVRRIVPAAALLMTASLAFGLISQSALAATPASPAFAPALAGTSTPKPTATSTPKATVVATATVTVTAAMTATMTDTMKSSMAYMTSAEAIYSDTARAVKQINATLGQTGKLDVKALQSSVTTLTAISTSAQKLAAAPGDNKDVGKKLTLLAQKIDTANTSVTDELKQKSPDAAKIKKAFQPVTSEADSLNSTLKKSMDAIHMAQGTPTPTGKSTPMAKGELPAGAVAPIDAFNCPTDHNIKGNKQSHIYHLPGDPNYKATKPEACFATTDAAVAAGYRAIK